MDRLQRPGETATRIGVILVSRFRDGRIHRRQELTWPDWRQMDAFDEY